MTKLLSMMGSGIAGAVVAFFAVTGLISSTTAAPDNNPAAGQVIHYGDR